MLNAVIPVVIGGLTEVVEIGKERDLQVVRDWSFTVGSIGGGGGLFKPQRPKR
jgi:hypothetical protein